MADAQPYVLQVTQTWRGVDSTGKIFDLHWALTVRTGGTDEAPVGNLYNAAGNIDTFYYESQTEVPLRNVNWRGDLPVGVLSQENLSDVQRILSHVDIHRNDPGWNCQNWVWSALRELRYDGFQIKPNMTWLGLVADMNGLLNAWETGDF